MIAFSLHLAILVIKAASSSLYVLTVDTVQMIPPEKNNLDKKYAEITDSQREK